MNIGKIDGATRELGKPPNWDQATQGPCLALPVRDDGPIMQSAWYPSPEEIEAMQRGCPVILTVWGRGHPPVNVGVSPTPSAAEQMCDHGKTAAEGCLTCAAADAPEVLIAPASNKKQ